MRKKEELNSALDTRFGSLNWSHRISVQQKDNEMFQHMDRMKREERDKEVRREVGREPGICECMELMDGNVMV